MAAFANGVALHARAQDDTHYASQAHPGAAILPAALALAEQRGTDGATLLAALVAGYEMTAGEGGQRERGVEGDRTNSETRPAVSRRH